MKKQKIFYRFYRYDGKPLEAKREISFECKLVSKMLLDELCFQWNKHQLMKAIDSSIDEGDKETFVRLSEEYKHYIWE